MGTFAIAVAAIGATSASAGQSPEPEAPVLQVDEMVLVKTEKTTLSVDHPETGVPVNVPGTRYVFEPSQAQLREMKSDARIACVVSYGISNPYKDGGQANGVAFVQTDCPAVTCWTERLLWFTGVPGQWSTEATSSACVGPGDDSDTTWVFEGCSGSASSSWKNQVDGVAFENGAVNCIP